MEKVAITGLTWMEVMAKFKENGEMDSAKVDFNGSELDHLIANQFVKPDAAESAETIENGRPGKKQPAAAYRAGCQPDDW